MTETDDLTQQVEDFYEWSRNYWIDLSRHENGQASGMLNFGLWNRPDISMYEAQEELRSLIVSRLGVIPVGSSLLEIGGGIGGAAVRFIQDNPDSRLTCLDLVPGQLKLAMQRAKEAKVDDRIRFELGSSMDMPFDDGIFDYSYCIESSFHYHDKLSFLRENFRVLKPGGLAVIADITCEDTGRVSFRSGNYFCSTAEMKRLTLLAGFELLEITQVGGQVFVPLKEHVERFNHGQRNKLCRYWNLVTKNYAELATDKCMEYDIFLLHKP